MMRNALIAAAIAAFSFSATAAQAAFVSINGGQEDSFGAFNNFEADIDELFGGAVFLENFTLDLSAGAILTFTEIAAESGFNNSFSVNGETISENGNFNFVDNLVAGTSFSAESITATFGPGEISGLSFSNGRGLTASLGTREFGIFFEEGVTELTQFILAFDDNGAGPDDNHDDYLVLVDVAPVPVPAAGLLFGSALLGAGAWRRRNQQAKLA